MRKGRARRTRAKAKDKTQAKRSQTAIEGELLYRSAVVEVHTRGDEPAVIGLAFSSESPVERIDFRTGENFQEILSHNRADVDLSRATDGLPLLVDHGGPQVGLVRNIGLGADGKLRGTLTFGAHPDAEWIRQDMVSGIRVKVSVGYRLGPELGERTGDVRRFAWQPLEVSSVSIPADSTVGVGRNQMGMGDDNMKDDKKDTAELRVRELGELAGEYDAADELPGWLADGTSVSDAKDSIIAGLRSAAGPPVSGAPAVLTNRQPDRIDDIAVQHLRDLFAGNDDGGRKSELNREAERQGQVLQRSDSVVIPNTVTAKRILTAGSSPGSQLVQTDVQQTIEFLGPDPSLLQKLGARFEGGLVGDALFPRVTARPGASWLATETLGSDQADTSPTMDSITLTPRQQLVVSIVSQQALRQASTDPVALVTELITDEIQKDLAVAAINGAGSGGVPEGILQNSGVTTVSLGTDGAIPTFADFVDLETQQAANNADDGRLAYLTTPAVRGVMRTTDRSTNTASFVWDGSMGESNVNGYPAFASTLVPSNLTKGTSTTVAHGVIFGNFSELIVGSWGSGTELIVDNFTLAAQAKVRLIGLAMTDIGIRHGASFSVYKDAFIS